MEQKLGLKYCMTSWKRRIDTIIFVAKSANTIGGPTNIARKHVVAGMEPKVVMDLISFMEW